MSRIFSGSHWTGEELLQILKQLEMNYAKGTTQVSFQGQTVIYSAKNEMLRAIESLRRELGERGLLEDTKNVKRVRFQTKSKGFD